MKVSTGFAKLFLALALATTMLVAGLSVAAAPGGNGGGLNASQFCAQNNNFGLSHGTCVSIAVTTYNENAGAFRAHFCQFLIKINFGGFTSVGDCVSTLPKDLS